MEDFDQFAKDYKTILDDSLTVGGEKGDYFAQYKASCVAKRIGEDFTGNILDYGCGIGLLSSVLHTMFPQATIDGFDVSAASIEHVPLELKAQGLFTSDLDEIHGLYDVIIIANVLHHTELVDRQKVIAHIKTLLKKQGRIFIFEHNPYNPMTQKVVRESPLDKGVILLPPHESRSYLKELDFSNVELDFIVFFPKFLSKLRWCEPYLNWLPYGAQYMAQGQVK